MAEVIDSLIVSLGLDPSQYKTEAAKARADLARTAKAADDAANKVADNQKRVARSDAENSKAMQQRADAATDSFKRLTGAAVGLFSVFKVGQGVATITAQLTSADAAAGRLATNLGINVQRLGGLQNALAKIGGSPGDAGSGLGALVNARQQILQGQMPASAPYLQMAGVTLNDLQNPQQALDKLSDYFKSVGATRAQFIGGQMGLPSDLINLMEGGSKSFEAAWNAGAANAPTGKDATAAQGLQAAFNQVDQDFTEAARRLKTDLTPALEWLLGKLDEVAQWAKAHPAAAGAAGLGLTVAGGAVGAAMLRRLAASILGRGGAGAAAEAAEATSAAEVVAAGGSVSLAGPLAAAALALAPSSIGTPESNAFENRPIGQPLAADQSLPPEAQAFLGSVASGESKNRYNALYGGGTFSGYGSFPQWAGVQVGTDASGNPIMTHAAGAYQFQPGTWAEAAKALGLTDFSPASQDKAAWYLASKRYFNQTGRDLLTDLQAHDPKTDALIKSTLAPTWTSLNTRSDSEFASSLNAKPAPANSSSGLPSSVTSYLDSLRSGTSADAQHGSDSASATTNNTTNTTHVGEVHVHTAATDADGVAKGLSGAMMRYSWAAQQNAGLA